METEMIDRLFLELSQFTSATTKRELDLLAVFGRIAIRADRRREECIENCQFEDAVAWRDIADAAREGLQGNNPPKAKGENEG